jgi:hypothetical protein
VFEDSVTTALAPGTALMQLLFGKQVSYSIAAIARLGVADHMSATPVSIEFLADKVDAHAPFGRTGLAHLSSAEGMPPQCYSGRSVCCRVAVRSYHRVRDRLVQRLRRSVGPAFAPAPFALVSADGG